jgi:hypothetical protein
VKCEVGGVFRCCAQHYLEYLRSQTDFCVECDFALNLNTLLSAVRNPLFKKKGKTRKLGLSAIKKVIRVREYAMQRGGNQTKKVKKNGSCVTNKCYFSFVFLEVVFNFPDLLERNFKKLRR